MNKKPFAGLEKTLFARVEKKEKELAERLLSARTDPAMISYIFTLYNSATDKDGKVRYKNLTKRTDKDTARALSNLRDELAAELTAEEYAPILAEYPLTVLRFDRLNRMEAATAYYALEELRKAIKQAEILSEHFEAWADTVYERTEAYFGIKAHGLPIFSTAWKTSLYHQFLTVGREAGERISRDIIRGQSAAKTAEDIGAYLDRREENITKRILFTEDTRITEENGAEIVAPYSEAFHSVALHDGYTCPDCLAIEKEQKQNPVPISSYLPGETAPPFHPYCRCWIEFIWKE